MIYAKMKTLKYQQFTDVQFLKSIKPARMNPILNPYADYLASRGFTFPESRRLSDSQFDQLAAILASPDHETPAAMLDALHVVNGIATRANVDLLFDRIDGLQAKFADEDDPHPGDVAIEAFALNRDAVEHWLSHRSTAQRRSFTSFQAASIELPKLPANLGRANRSLEQAIDDWFDARRCGRGALVQCHQDDLAAYFNVAHGTPMHRQRILADGRHDQLIFRPLQDDIAIFDKLIGELRINAETLSQRELYRRMIGLHVFGDEELFPAGDKYSLDPLVEYGEASLSVAAIDELTAAECHTLKILLPGDKPEELTSRRQDVLEVLQERLAMLDRNGFADIRLTEAKFKLTFIESRRSRTVTIKPPNVAIYSRDGDGEIVEKFLRQRGFINDREWPEYEIAGNAMAGS